MPRRALQQKKRIETIDFWRGFALVAILVNHIPGNILGVLTPRNFGFSDSAELFVFFSGVSVYLAYGNWLGDDASAVLALARRIAGLYGAHLVLTGLALALFWFLNDYTQNDLLASEYGRATPFLDPLRGALGIVTLSHQLAYFNILPLYIVLMVVAPVLLALALRGRVTMLAVSAAFYVVARVWGVNLPSWPEPGGWYFDPFDWQLMFALGIFSGAALREEGIPYSPAFLRFSQAFTVVSAIVASNLFGLAPGLIEEAGRYLDWDKSELGVARIVDFVALAYTVYFSRLNVWLRASPFFDFLVLLGRNPLSVFCAGSLLSALGQILSDTRLASPLLDVAYISGALMLLKLLAETVESAGADPARISPPARESA